MTTKDDSTMRSFDTGATRDTADGKLDMEGFTHPMVEKQFAKYMNMNRLQSDGNLRDSDNWQKGIPIDAYIKSLRRHHDDAWLEHRGFPTKSGMIAALCGLIFNAKGYLLEYLKERDFVLQDFDGDEPTPEMRARQEGVQETSIPEPPRITHEVLDLLDNPYESILPDVCETPEDHSLYFEVTKLYETKPQLVAPSHIGFCMDEYKKDVCRDCPTEKECLDMAAREDAEAWYEKSKQDFLALTQSPWEPVTKALSAWIDETNEDLEEVPELPVCFGCCDEYAAMPFMA